MPQPKQPGEPAIPMHASHCNRLYYLPRLAAECYLGDAIVHWTLPISMRATGWLTDLFHARFRETMLHAASRESLICPAYCLMPDHIHLVWMGLHRESNQRQGMKFLREHLAPALKPLRFQHQAHDHVLKELERRRDAFMSVCNYILMNPVRGRLADEPSKWPYRGSIVPGYPALDPCGVDYWRIFWQCHGRMRSADAGEWRRPGREGETANGA